MLLLAYSCLAFSRFETALTTRKAFALRLGDIGITFSLLLYSPAADLGLVPTFTVDLVRSSHTSDYKSTLVATLPGAWHDRVSIGTGLPSVSKL